MNLPTREEINIHDSLDERHAAKMFYGKTLEQAEVLFRENFLFYQEDLMWMGVTAFRFYVRAAIRYTRSPESQGDSDAINCFVGLLDFRLEKEHKELRPVAQALADACRYIVAHYDRFDVDDEIYGDLRPRYESLFQQFSANS
jgi:hypothetical protein